MTGTAASPLLAIARRRTLRLIVVLFGSGDPVAPAEPAVEVYVGATSRAERVELVDTGFPQIGQVFSGLVIACYVFIRNRPTTAPASGSRRQRVGPAAWMDREPFAGEQGPRLVERQAHHIGVGADGPGVAHLIG
jgi:hypothetical protein